MHRLHLPRGPKYRNKRVSKSSTKNSFRDGIWDPKPDDWVLGRSGLGYAVSK